MADLGPRVAVMSWTGQRFTSKTWISQERDDSYLRHLSVTDLDGDDDLVMVLAEQGLRLLESTGSTFMVMPGKGRVVAPRKSTAGTLGPILER